MAHLRQMNLQYDPEEDRLLLRMNTAEGTEFRFWLTRRMIGLMWPLLLKLLELDRRILEQPDPEARKALVGLKHEEAIRESDFSSPYENGKPVNEEPMQVIRVHFTRKEQGGYRIIFEGKPDQRVEISLSEALLHSFCRLIEQIAEKTQWGLSLKLPAMGAPETKPMVSRLH